ncbi:phytanoyl-CoA dioxygenase family protein [Streptomyces lomondensis]|uniref:Protein involved in biosynthesis of mitomycin antibiotics/polyketide fumonisin n=1 Tax=Streptomyces lomondensis TaxID=68229 RepID=A0ABQ2XJ66_9ACTN|nr:phytanoyl-CoA dioxygenase family protein [Streptomyces lomondensis]MCF0079755.1 phytanoyl-CoA dioxygenase family protein [Streptomyces lomondensis]GGX20209.1 protein involved in biosynthesis of mitomycin antibiotics/polyketide fumonisin [Streptomyces lomondensis]
MTVTGNGAGGASVLDPAGLRRYREGFEEDGFAVVRGLFGAGEIGRLCDEFEALRAAGPVPGHFQPRASGPDADPLHVWPRVMHPHEINDLAREVLLDARLRTVLEVLLGEEVLAAQSMFYFKPPGARGQALHQDNFYLRVEPGTCVAAWVACDVIDRENGGLEVVPGTHRMDLFCPETADAEVSFAREYVPPPPGLAPVPVDMEPGDVLFFNGSLVHGSQPNRSVDRFRRSFIGHYVGRSAERIGGFYRTLTMSGARVVLPESEGAGPCGTEFAPRGPH